MTDDLAVKEWKCAINKKEVKEARDVAVELLKKCDINDTITVRCKPKNAPTARCEHDEWVAIYRGLSQFSGHGPIFWVCDEQPMYEDMLGKPDRHEVFRGMVDSILHEYGHVIAEWGKKRNPDITMAIQERFDDEEQFAEEFIEYVRDGCSGDDRYDDVLRMFKKDALTPTSKNVAYKGLEFDFE